MTTAMPLPVVMEDSTRELDLLTTCAIRLGMRRDVPIGVAAVRLVDRAHGRRSLLTAALARIDRSLATEWSEVAARADEALRAARERTAA